ncbi:MAG: hypothetical protein ACKO6L_05515, partial [Flavobacteriales bacterium]
KGSICVNGVSLTVVDAHRQGFSVCIIPYTYEHTTFQFMRVGDAHPQRSNSRHSHKYYPSQPCTNRSPSRIQKRTSKTLVHH